jgi:photosystem II stability/assembly factor-like uncharacterized protein
MPDLDGTGHNEMIVGFQVAGNYRVATAHGGGPPGGDVRAIVFDPSSSATLYAGTGGGGVFKSKNGGTSWASTGLRDAEIWALAIDPNIPHVIYAGGTDGVFKSSDGGASWTSKNAGLGPDLSGIGLGTGVSALVVDPSNSAVYAGTYIPGSDISSGFIYKSTDGGDNWVQTPFHSPCAGDVTALAMHPQNSNRVYALFDGNFLCRTVDGGNSWSELPWIGTIIGMATSIALDRSSEATVYVGSSHGIFKSHARVPLPYAESAPHCANLRKIPDGLNAAEL